MQKYLYLLVALLLYPTVMAAQVPQTELKDILEFKIDTTRHKIAGWLVSSLAGQMRSGIEDDTLKNDKKVLSFTSPRAKDAKSIYYSISTGFLMPDINNFHSMEASFLCKNQGYDTVRIIFSGFDTYGNILSSDTLKASKTGEWCESIKRIKIPKVSYMRLDLEMKGGASLSAKTLWVDRIRLKVDGRDLTEFPVPDLKKDYIPDINKIVKFSFESPSSYKQIPVLTTKKIVALGESLHGSGTLEESAIQIMKYRVLYGNCKLILLESPLERMLSINRFVLGDERIALDSIANNLDLNISSKNLLDFIVWLRKYNQNTTRKVFLLGMDAPSTAIFVFETQLFEYFYRMNENRMNNSIKKFLRLVLTDSRTAMGPLFSSIKNDIDFKHNMDSLEIKIIEHYWSNWLKVPDYERVNMFRDSIMYSNVKFMTDLLCAPSETVTLYSHLEHACYDKTHTLSLFPRMSYGSLLKKDFGDDYCTIGLLAYQGKVSSLPNEQQMKTLKDKSNFVIQTLKPIQSNSVEHLLYKSGLDYFYAPVTLLPNTQLYIRAVTNEKQFVNLIHPYHYMDGIIYVKDSEAMRIIHGDIPIFTKYQNLIDRFDKYRTLIKQGRW